MINLTPDDISNQVAAIDEEAKSGMSSVIADVDNIQNAVLGSKVLAILKADLGFGLGILIGYRLAEAKIMTQMLEGK